jgi:hypothetical protein
MYEVQYEMQLCMGQMHERLKPLRLVSEDSPFLTGIGRTSQIVKSVSFFASGEM